MPHKIDGTGFRERLIATLVGLVVLISLGMGALLTLYLFEEKEARAMADLDVGERLTRNVIAHRTVLELARLSILQKQDNFQFALALRDTDALSSALKQHTAGAGFAYVIDNRRQPVAASLDQPLPKIPERAYREAQQQSYARWLMAQAGQGVEMILVQIRMEEFQGWLLAGLALDNELADIISRLSETGVMFRAQEPDGKNFSIFAASEGNKLPEDSLTSPPGDAHFLEDPQFFTRIIPLDADRPQGFQAILLVSKAESLQRFYQRVREMAALLALILVLAILLALYMARTLGRPVQQLANYARAVGMGQAPKPPQVTGSREIAQLSQAFGDMLQRLGEREEEIRYSATHDDLTGLGNRSATLQLCKEIFQGNQRSSVIGIRLTELPEINDSLGLELGDKVLLGVTKHLKTHAPDALLIARTGGDEFLLILPETGRAELGARAQALAELLRSPMPVDNTPFSLRLSVITLMLPDDARSENQLRRRLNLTFEKAADERQMPVVHYEPGEDETHLRQLKLIADLHTAIASGGLTMNYQAKVDFRSGKLLQVEALVRWIHPELGFISPEEFIFLAERSGQIQDLTSHILQLVAQDAHAWQSSGLELGVAINLSTMDLTWPGLAGYVRRYFEPLPMGISSVTLEVTESAVMDDPATALRTLQQLRETGVTLSVDDFGTGYSSLSQLKKMPVQELKIDKSFVLRLTTEPQDQLIVRSTIDMAHGLGLSVVAEGIESIEAWALLQQWGCDLGQGFGLARPVPASDLTRVAGELAARWQELMPRQV